LVRSNKTDCEARKIKNHSHQTQHRNPKGTDTQPCPIISANQAPGRDFECNGVFQQPMPPRRSDVRVVVAQPRRLRIAILVHRLVAFQHDQVTFRWKDYAHGNKKRIMTLGSQEFLRRFLLHVLPRGFVRIRFFGFLANRRRATLLPLCQRLLADQPIPHPPAATTSSPTQPTCFRCPKCSTPMVIVERLSALTGWQLTTRSAVLDSS
jgi:hypothetical protein